MQNNTQPLWLRITTAVVLFLVVGAGYLIWWGFWTGMSHWADTVPNQNTADQSYLEFVYGPMLLFFLLVPFVLTFLNIRWLWKGFYWLLSLILAFLGWVVWFIVIEATSK